MSVNILFIGDPHFQINNLTEVDLFIEQITELAIRKKPDLIVIAGDLLHTHERLHTTVLNKAHDLVHKLRKITTTYILVGNHDYISNTQFLTQNHWMNSMKEWRNVVIVDSVVSVIISGKKFVFVPYVYPGRFTEALDTIEGTWKDSQCIFAHQEFEGCKMGAIVSVDGDKWSTELPPVVSGHIHSKQTLTNNVFYPGTPMQHAFGESETNIVAFLNFEQVDENYILEEIKLRLPKKKILYLDISDIDTYRPSDGDDKVRLTVSGTYEQFKAVKKTSKYKQLLNDGIKVVFKAEERVIDNSQTVINEVTDFSKILNTIVVTKKDQYLLQVYEHVLNGKKIKTDDVFFL